jgi:benzoylformate decarboxylase
VGQHDFLRFGPRAEDKLGVSHTGNSLGWGVGAAVGAKLAAPDRQVVLSIGDGSLMYSAAGFWTMARYEVPVLTVVWNNRNYQTVRNAAYRYNRRMAETGKYHGLYLGDPDIDFVKLAESQGVRGERVTNPGDIAAALKRGTAETHAGKPYLLEFVIGRVGGGAESTWHQKFSAAALQGTRA